jgi:murein L,D-transpeptidase YcbB/YkuD
VKFQKKHKLDADGLVGTKTAKALNRELRKLAASSG